MRLSPVIARASGNVRSRRKITMLPEGRGDGGRLMTDTVPRRLLSGKPARLMAILVLLLSLVGGLPAQPAYAQGPCPPPTAEGQVIYGCNDLSRNLQDVRLWLRQNSRGQTDPLFKSGIRPSSNFAIARMQDGTFLIGYSANDAHAEERLLQQARGQTQRIVWDPATRSVTFRSPQAGTINQLYTEIEPCANKCDRALRDANLRNRTTWSWRWNAPAGTAPEDRSTVQKEIRNVTNNNKTGEKPHAIRQLFRNGAPGRIDTPSTLRSGVTGAVQRQAGARLGGIDFSAIQLRYVSDGGADGNTYSFRAPTTPGQDSTDGTLAIFDAIESLGVWMTLDPSKFWVNLNPEEPDRIIDPDLGITDTGRVLLEADLELKRSGSALLDPNTEIGAEFWDRMDGAGLDQFCTRNWIVPEPATVREVGSELYILAAPLAVRSAGEDFQLPGETEDTCPADSEPAIEIYREVILPELTRVVNEAPEYTDLRRVYISRVAAEWYRQRIVDDGVADEFGINSNDATIFESTEPWDPVDVFEEYVDEINGTEFTGPDGRVVTTGGVDFTQPVEVDNLDDATFQNQYPQLPTVVQTSVEEEVALTPDETDAFAGGADLVPPLLDPPDDGNGGGGGDDGRLPVTGTPVWMVATVGASLVVIGAFVVWRWRNRRVVFHTDLR